MVADAGDWEDRRQVEHMGGSTETAAQSNVAANDLMAHCRVVAPVERPCAFSQDAGCEPARFSGLGKSWLSRDAMASWRRLEEAAAMAASGCRIGLRNKNKRPYKRKQDVSGQRGGAGQDDGRNSDAGGVKTSLMAQVNITSLPSSFSHPPFARRPPRLPRRRAR